METSQNIQSNEVLFPNADLYCIGNTLQYLGNPVITPQTRVKKRKGHYLQDSGQSRLLDDFIECRENMDFFRKELFGYIRKYLENKEDAEDVMNEIWIKVKNNRDKFDPARKFRPWLFTLATNYCIDYQRRNKRHRRMVRLDDANINRTEDESEECCYGDILEAPFERTAEDNENSEIVKRSLSMLPENSRQIIELVYFQGLKCRETAEALGIPIGTVKSRLYNAIRCLKESPLIQKLNEAA